MGFSGGNDVAKAPLFEGMRYFLSGFDRAEERQLIDTLDQHGGSNVGQYTPSCSHIIVSQHTYDDPICAAARKDKKALVTKSWVLDSLQQGVLKDTTSVLYLPVRSFAGVPGAKNICICLTGYQGLFRREIETMVAMMGAEFSRPLDATKVTHLVCYKFEGDKYKLAEMKKLKLVNHRWLEDCLKSWSLLDEGKYNMSGWELEVSEGQANDPADDEVPPLEVVRSPEKKQPVADEKQADACESSKLPEDEKALDDFQVEENLNLHTETNGKDADSEATTQQYDGEDDDDVMEVTGGLCNGKRSEDDKSPSLTKRKISDCHQQTLGEVSASKRGRQSTSSSLSPRSQQPDERNGPGNEPEQPDVSVKTPVSKSPGSGYKTAVNDNAMEADEMMPEISRGSKDRKREFSVKAEKLSNSGRKTRSRSLSTSAENNDDAESNHQPARGSQPIDVIDLDQVPDEEGPRKEKGAVGPEKKSSRELKRAAAHHEAPDIRKEYKARSVEEKRVHVRKVMTTSAPTKAKPWFALSGHTQEKKKYTTVVRRLRGHLCRDDHTWKDQTTHVVVGSPVRRTEKLFAAVASGRWILKFDYLKACAEAGKFVDEEPYEWHEPGVINDSGIDMGAPRKWRLSKQETACGAFEGLRVIIYGECILPSMDTLKRAIKAL